MTATLDAPPAPDPVAPPRPPVRLPFWLRTPPKTRRVRRPAPSPNEPRWWIAVAWLVLSALLLGFVAHVTLVGSLQHARAQQVLYQDLRRDLADATSPLGQLDVHGALVPDGTPIGLIEISTPDVDIEEVFVQGTAGRDLASAPGHRRDTVMPGQEGTSILMGRQATYGGPFGYLAALEEGDIIRITTGQGEAKYEVFGIRREGELLPQPLGAGEGRLELITADGSPLFPSGTLHIDAELVSTVQPTPAPVLTTEVLAPAEMAMAGDPSGLLPTLFCAQLLIMAAVAVRWVRTRWGMWQTVTIAIPVLVPLAAATSDSAITLLPNLL
jgi:sortase A